MNKNQNIKARPRIGIALGSGAARGYAHIGVIKAFHKANIPIDIIAGTSIGAVVGAAYALGYSIEELENLAVKMRWRSLFLLADPTFPRKGIIAGNKVEKYLEKLTKGKNFDQLEKPLIVVATDIISGEEVRINEGSVAKALRASIAIPGLFSPVILREKLLVDGSVTSPVPIQAAIEAGADIVIAVDVSSNIDLGSSIAQIWKRLETRPPKRIVRFIKNSNFEIIKVIGNTLKLCNHSKEITTFSAVDNKYCFVLKPNVGDVRWYEFYRVRECIRAGEIVAKQAVKILKHYYIDFKNFIVETEKQNLK